MTSTVLLSPALPSELLAYILHQHAHPTTLIICSPRAEFLDALTEDIHHDPTNSLGRSRSDGNNDPAEQRSGVEGGSGSSDPVVSGRKHPLLSSPLYQVATSRHIRLVYVPTVTHLRAYLAGFSPDDSKVPPPPAHLPSPGTRRQSPAPHLVVYGLLAVHRDTSEWSAQGIGTTAAALVEVVHRLRWRAAVIEPQSHPPRPSHDHDQQLEGAVGVGGGRASLEDLLREACPMLSGGARRFGTDADEGAWTGRTVEIGRILGRWFCFQRGSWDYDEGAGKS